MPKTFPCFLLLLASAAACAQAPTTATGNTEWSRVQALPVGTQLHIKATHHAPLCRLHTVTADALTCSTGGTGKDVAYAKSEIKSIKLTRRGVSAGIMAGIGAGAGAATVKLVANQIAIVNGQAKASVYAGGAGIGAILFAPIGYFADPFRGPLVYQAR